MRGTQRAGLGDAWPWETDGAVQEETLLHPPKKGEGSCKSTTESTSDAAFAGDAGLGTRVQICSPQTPSWENLNALLEDPFVRGELRPGAEGQTLLSVRKENVVHLAKAGVSSPYNVLSNHTTISIRAQVTYS